MITKERRREIERARYKRWKAHPELYAPRKKYFYPPRPAPSKAITTPTHVCLGCEKEKSLAQFRASKAGKIYRKSKCMDCNPIPGPKYEYTKTLSESTGLPRATVQHYCNNLSVPRDARCLRAFHAAREFLKEWKRELKGKERIWKEERKARRDEASQNSFRNSKLRRLAYYSNRYRTDPAFRASICVRSRVRNYLKKKKVSALVKFRDLIGCSAADLKAHLESQFLPGMTWENSGKVWHIDHKRPLSAFDVSDPEQLKAANNFRNLQPLWAMENILKSNKILPEYEKAA